MPNRPTDHTEVPAQGTDGIEGRGIGCIGCIGLEPVGADILPIGIVIEVVIRHQVPVNTDLLVIAQTHIHHHHFDHDLLGRLIHLLDLTQNTGHIFPGITNDHRVGLNIRGNCAVLTHHLFQHGLQTFCREELQGNGFNDQSRHGLVNLLDFLLDQGQIFGQITDHQGVGALDRSNTADFRQEILQGRLPTLSVQVLQSNRRDQHAGRGPVQCLQFFLHGLHRFLSITEDDGVCLIDQNNTPCTRGQLGHDAGRHLGIDVLEIDRLAGKGLNRLIRFLDRAHNTGEISACIKYNDSVAALLSHNLPHLRTHTAKRRARLLGIQKLQLHCLQEQLRGQVILDIAFSGFRPVHLRSADPLFLQDRSKWITLRLRRQLEDLFRIGLEQLCAVRVS